VPSASNFSMPVSISVKPLTSIASGCKADGATCDGVKDAAVVMLSTFELPGASGVAFMIEGGNPGSCTASKVHPDAKTTKMKGPHFAIASIHYHSHNALSPGL